MADVNSSVPMNVGGANNPPDQMPQLLSDQHLLISAGPQDSFGSARPVLSAVSKLSFGRIPGRAIAAHSAGLSHPQAGLMMAAHGRQRPMAFVVATNGCDLAIRVGEQQGSKLSLARTLSRNLGVNMGSLSEIKESQLLSFEYSCLTLLPAHTPSSVSTKTAPPSLDFMLEALVGIPFIYIVFATPEPNTEIRQAIQSMNLAAQDMDRTVLKIGQQQNVDRSAREASSFVEKQLMRFQRGSLEGLWRTSILIGCQGAAQAAYAAGVAAGCVKASGVGELVIKNHRCLNGHLAPLPNVNCLTSEELADLWMMPSTDRSGYYVRKAVRFDVDHPDVPGGINLGRIKSGEITTANEFKIAPDILTHHTLVCGHTGSGKSSTIRHLLRQLAKANLPFLVLEPAKSEYASLRNEIADLTVLQAGKTPVGDEVPFQLNPFAFPKGVQLSSQIDMLKQCFTASFGLTPPTPYLLESALRLAYKSRGWNTDSGTHRFEGDRLSYPTMTDLLDQIDEVVDLAGYDHEVNRNLKGALKTRIGNLCQGAKGLALDTRDEISNDQLFNSPLVLELRHFSSDPEKALVMGLILSRLYQLRETTCEFSESDKLKHLLVIEEAHRLLKRTEAQSAEFGNMAHQAVEAFANQLAEVRAYGQGVLVAEQIPAKLATEVVKQCGLKIIHRLLPADDRQLVGSAMILEKEQMDKLALLKVGEVVVHCEGMDGAVLVQVPKPQSYPGKSVKGASGTQLSGPSRAGDRLSRSAAVRLAARQFLSKPELTQVADALLLNLLSGMSWSDATGSLPILIGQLIDQSGYLDRILSPVIIEELAIEAALERRALHYLLPQSELDRWIDCWQKEPKQLGKKLTRSLTRSAGRKAWCQACPTKCRVAYEGSVLAGEQRLQDECDEIIEMPREEWSDRMTEAVGRAAERHYSSTEILSALACCTIGHLLSKWGIRVEQVKQLLAEIARDPSDNSVTEGSASAIGSDRRSASKHSKRNVSDAGSHSSQEAT